MPERGYSYCQKSSFRRNIALWLLTAATGGWPPQQFGDAGHSPATKKQRAERRRKQQARRQQRARAR